MAKFAHCLFEQVLSANAVQYQEEAIYNPRGSTWFSNWSILDEPGIKGIATQIKDRSDETLDGLEKLTKRPIRSEERARLREAKDKVAIIGFVQVGSEGALQLAFNVDHERLARGACWNCGRTEKTKCCTGCKKALYCSVDCQKAGWQRGHKEICPHWSKDGGQQFYVKK